MRQFILTLALIAAGLVCQTSGTQARSPDLRQPPPDYHNRLPAPPPFNPSPDRPSFHLIPTGPDSGALHVQHGERSVTVEASPGGVGVKVVTPVGPSK
jgi:hypothetical protein